MFPQYSIYIFFEKNHKETIAVAEAQLDSNENLSCFAYQPPTESKFIRFSQIYRLEV